MGHQPQPAPGAHQQADQPARSSGAACELREMARLIGDAAASSERCGNARDAGTLRSVATRCTSRAKELEAQQRRVVELGLPQPVRTTRPSWWVDPHGRWDVVAAPAGASRRGMVQTFTAEDALELAPEEALTYAASLAAAALDALDAVAQPHGPASAAPRIP